MCDKNIIHTFVVLAYKESEYLEDCIKSVKNQKYNSNVVIATTTDNKYIRKMAKKYNLDVVVGKHTNIGGDFDFAKNVGKTELVTVAHQDDVYDYDYSYKVVEEYKKDNNTSIIFTDYYEIRKGDKVYSNLNLKIKRVLLLPLRIKKLGKYKFFKRWVLRYGNSICCPAVTFVKNNVPKEVFTCDLTCNIDWYAWEKLSRKKGSFIYIKDKLMGHRISEESTTTDIINSGIRTKEDNYVFNKFWPSFISSILTKIYRNSEKSNKV
ncbi:MAG: glycosyltransferase family A protein [Bacilli bacterium]|nr:glycosyltransferase family A protein [Bacilli bacterium]